MYNDVYKCNLLVVKGILRKKQMLVLSIINLDLNHFTTDTDNVSFLNCFQFEETLYDSYHVIYIICSLMQPLNSPLVTLYSIDL